MKKLWIHIGAHKTGTTYVQQQFAEFEQAIASQGILYPKTGREILWGHHRFSSAVQNKTAFAGIKTRLATEIAGHEGDVFISSETFEDLTADQLRQIGQLFGAQEITVLYMYRNWTKLLYSKWQEMVKHGGTEHLYKFAFVNVAFHRGSKHLNFNDPIAKAEKAFGAGTVKIAQYEAVKAQGDLTAFFLGILGLKGISPQAAKLVNASLVPASAELLRALNVLMSLHDVSPATASAMRKHYLRELKKGADPAIRKLSAIMQPHIQPFDDVSRSAVAKNFFRKFRELHRAKFLIPEDPSAAMDEEPPDVVSADYLLDPKAGRAIQRIYDGIANAVRAAAEAAARKPA